MINSTQSEGITPDPTGATKYSDCTSDKIKSSKQNIEILAALENILECAGWCNGDHQPTYFYRFRNLNDCDQ